MLKKGSLTEHLQNLPGMPELHQLLAQALEKRGKTLQISWRGRKLAKFTLEIICHLKGGDPQWILYCKKEGKSQETLFDYTSCDVLLVCNHIATSCSEASKDDSATDADLKGIGSGGLSIGKGTKKTPRLESVASEASGEGRPYVAAPSGAVPNQTPVQAVTSTQAQKSGAGGGPPPRVGQGGQSSQSSSSSDSRGAASSSSSAPPARQEGSAGAASASAPPAEPKPVDDSGVVSLPMPPRGDLAQLPIDQLIKTVTSKNLTGKLEVSNNQDLAIVYIQDGVPVDATASDAVGDDAMIELLTWRAGQYSFESRVLRNGHTVHMSIDALLAQSKQLTEQVRFLQAQGMLPSSTLVAGNNELKIAEINGKLDLKLDEESIAKLNSVFNGKVSVEEILRHIQISRIKLTHLVYHLISTGQITVSNEERPQETLVLQPKVIDTAAIQTVMMSLRNAETGMFSYPAFLYFLEQEYFRSYRSRTWFSIVVFEMREIVGQSAEQQMKPLSSEAIVEAVLRISQLKRHVDLLAHYDSSDYAMLLPNTKASGSRIFCNRIIKALQDAPLAGIPGDRISISMGAASVPEDFKDLSSLLGAADLAMNHAKQTEQKLVLYREIASLTSRA